MSETQSKETSDLGRGDTSSISAEPTEPVSSVKSGEENSSSPSGEKAAPADPVQSPVMEDRGQTDKSAENTNSYASSPAAAQTDEPFKSKWDEIFKGCAKIGPLYLLLFLCLMIWPDYWHAKQAAFCPPEFRSVTAYLHCIQDGSWIAPMALDNGHWAIPQWPLFYMFIGLLAYIPGLVEAGLLIPIACASSAAIALVGAYFFTHAAGFGATASFAAGLILFCAPIFAPLHHFFGPVTLASGLMLFSLAFFCRGWRANHSWISLPLAFIFAALAGLCGGVLYIAVPFIGSLFYLIWQGRYRRGQSLDAIAGFLLMLIIIGSWMIAISLGKYPENYMRLLVADSVRFSWPPQHYWYLAFIAGALGVLPWTLEIFGVSWFRVLKDSIKSFGASRRDNGSALMWIALVLACCFSLFIPHTPLAAITIACLLAPLFGKAFVRMPAAGNRFFFLLASIFTLLVGCLLLALHFDASSIFNLLPVKPPAIAEIEIPKLAAIIYIGVTCILGGLGGLFFVRRARGGGGMIYASLVTVIIGQIALFMLAPDLQNNPRLPLKKLDAIVQEVEAAKLRVIPDLPMPTEPNPQVTAPEAVAPAPESATSEPGQPAESTSPEALPPAETQTLPDSPDASVQPESSLMIPSQGSQDSSSQENMPALPPGMEDHQANPETSGQSAGETPMSVPEAAGAEKEGDITENPAAGIPMTLPDAIEVPETGKEEVKNIEEHPKPEVSQQTPQVHAQ